MSLCFIRRYHALSETDTNTDHAGFTSYHLTLHKRISKHEHGEGP